MQKLKIAVVFFSLSLFLAACAETQGPVENSNASNDNGEISNTAVSPTPLDDLAAGKKHFVENCVKCHRETGKGGPVEIEGKELKPDDLTTAKMIKEPDEEYMEYMKEGIPDEGMPAFEEILSETEMKQVLKYIREELQKQ